MQCPNRCTLPLLESLIAQGKVAKHGSLLASADFRETKSREREEFEAKVLPLLLRGGTTPPRTREIVEQRAFR
jgi:hypothetical protein